MDEQHCVYVMSNKHNAVLHTGVTSDLKRPVYAQGEGSGNGFTGKDHLHKFTMRGGDTTSGW